MLKDRKFSTFLHMLAFHQVNSSLYKLPNRMKIRKLTLIFTHFVLFSQISTQIRMKIGNVTGEKLEFSDQRSAFVSIGLIGITVVKF